MRLLAFCGRAIFSGAVFILTIAAIVTIWMYGANILVAVEDLNLILIKWATSYLPIAYASKTEAALRVFGAEKAFILMEIGGTIKLLCSGVLYRFRSHQERSKD